MVLKPQHWNWNWNWNSYYKGHYFPFHKAYGVLTEQDGGLVWEDTIHRVTWHFDIVVTWLIKKVISQFSQGLWTPNLAGWLLRMRRLHLQCHVTLQHRDDVTNEKCYIYFFARLIDPNVAGWWFKTRTPHPQTHVKHRLRGHMTNQKRYISTFAKPIDSRISRVVT